MCKTCNTDQMGKRGRLCINNHLHGKIRTEFRKSKTSQLRSADLLWRDIQRRSIFKQTHDIVIVQRHKLGIQSCTVLQETDHGRIIMPQNIQFQQVMINGMIIIMRCYRCRCHIICRMLYRCKRIDVLAYGKYDDSAGVLTGSSSDTYKSLQHSVDLTFSLPLPKSVIELLYITVCRLVCQTCNGSCTESLPVSENNLCIFMCLTLIFTGEVQINIRFLISLESKECFKRNIESVLIHHMSAFRTSFIRHIASRFPGKRLHIFRIKITVMALRAYIMRT